jgi:dTDP-4-dehydrorhamnose reductase
MYKNSLILRITMTEKPFVHQKGYTNLYSNYIYQEEVVKILPKIIDKFGIINIGGKTRSVYSFGKIHNSKIVKLKCVDKKIPLKQTMNLKKLKKILDQ